MTGDSKFTITPEEADIGGMSTLSFCVVFRPVCDYPLFKMKLLPFTTPKYKGGTSHKDSDAGEFCCPYKGMSVINLHSIAVI